jgi:hypothetical protein
MTTRRGIARAFIMIGMGFAFAAPAAALPTMVRLGYTGCAACHSSPQGAGPLTDYGRGIDQAQSLRGGEYHAPAEHRRLTQDLRFVLQEQSTLPLKNPVRYHENVRLFDAEIARRGAKTLLYLTWARRQSPQTQESINRAVEDIATEIHARVVPVGPAWFTAMAQDNLLELYLDDGSHPTVAGSYLAACVFHASLFGEAPQAFSVSDALHLDRDVAARLHAVAASESIARR